MWRVCHNVAGFVGGEKDLNHSKLAFQQNLHISECYDHGEGKWINDILDQWHKNC